MQFSFYGHLPFWRKETNRCQKKKKKREELRGYIREHSFPHWLMFSFVVIHEEHTLLCVFPWAAVDGGCLLYLLETMPNFADVPFLFHFIYKAPFGFCRVLQEVASAFSWCNEIEMKNKGYFKNLVQYGRFEYVGKPYIIFGSQSGFNDSEELACICFMKPFCEISFSYIRLWTRDLRNWCMQVFPRLLTL